MEWYIGGAVGWILCGFIALVMNIRDHPRMQENIGGADIWPVIFGPFWLLVKLWQWIFIGRAA